MAYSHGHDLTKVFVKARTDRSYRESLVKEPKEFWMKIMHTLVQDNLDGEYSAEFAVYEYVGVLVEAILECGLVREAFAGSVISVGLIDALYDSLLVMLGPTGSLPHSKDELDLLMSVLGEPVERRPFVLAELILSRTLLRVYDLPTLLSALSKCDDKSSAHSYIGRFSAGCRELYSFELDNVFSHRFGYENPQHYDLKHLIKGYARGQPLAQFVVEIFTGGECVDDSVEEYSDSQEGDSLEDEEEQEKCQEGISEDLECIYLQLLLGRYFNGTLASLMSPKDRQQILDQLSDLLAEGFLDEHDFFQQPVYRYTTDNLECTKWFDDRFGGRERFRQLWIDSYERKPHKYRLISRDLPPRLV